MLTINKKINNFQILSHRFERESQLIRLKYKNILTDIKINLIGKIQLKNILMSIIAAKKVD